MEQFDKDGDSQLPPGFKFHPTDEELVACYLFRKVLDSTFTCRPIADVDLHKCEPWELPQRAKMGGKEWYFFSLRDRKYPAGLRTNRATEAGYWKATGKDKEIYSSNTTSSLVGLKKTLVFYLGRAPKGEKTNWVMHEFRLQPKFLTRDEWVICRVFHKNNNSRGNGRSRTKRQQLNTSTSFSLPPLLESSSYASATSAHTVADHDTAYSYESNAASKEHVPCFSTGFNFDSPSVFDLPPLPPSAASQENLQLPFVYSSIAAPPILGDGGIFNDGNMLAGNWMPLEENQKPGCTELDCIWRF